MAEFNVFSNLHMIEEKVYLGDVTAATTIAILKKFNITHILTIDVQPLPREIMDERYYTCLYFECTDLPDVDLLSHFEEAILFIKEAVHKGAVLVHCFHGLSRSATIVCAYLMEKYKISPEEALTRVQAKRMLAWPNVGFLAQLELYHKMNWKVDYCNAQYRMYLIQLNPNKLFDNDFDLISSFLEDRHLVTSSLKIQFKCKKCRKCLFTQSNVFSHIPGETVKWNKVEAYSANLICTKNLFLMPLPWMIDEAKSKSQGKMLCPGCKCKIGIFNLKGGRCICEATMLPCFLITAGQVDKCVPITTEVNLCELAKPNSKTQITSQKDQRSLTTQLNHST